jgi:ParB family chromosome partitioning protein
LQPLVVRPTGDDRWQIVAGHRRQQAAIRAGVATVPCIARLDLADAPAHVLLAALGENLRRDDLTDLEEARGYQAVLDLGLSATRIARLTGSKPSRVKQALAVTASEAASTAMANLSLALDQAAAIAEFEDDPDTAAYLIEQAQRGEGSFRHALSAKRNAREDNARRQAAADALSAAGITVLADGYEDPDNWPDATAIDRLVDPGDPERKALDADTHSDCPGHAAVIDQWDPERAGYYCTDPDTHGHAPRWASDSGTKSEPTDAQREAAKAERREVIANNRAWRDAEPVRREWLRDLLNRKRPPTGCLEFVTAEIMGRPDRVGDGSDAMLAGLLGVDSGGTWGRSVGDKLVAQATKSRLPLVLLAQVAADRETGMDVQTWRQHDPADEARWLRFLVSVGYTLSDIEQAVIDKVFPPADTDDTAGTDTDDADDEDPVTDSRPELTVIAGDADQGAGPENTTGDNDTA